MRKRTLYVIATSMSPDPYINAIAYSKRHLDVQDVCFVVIADHDYCNEDIDSSKTRVSTIFSCVNRQLEALVSGRYLRFDNRGNEIEEQILTNETNLETYQRCIDEIDRDGWLLKIFSLDKLDEEIDSIIDNKREAIFDVTALMNNLLVDVVSVLLSIDHKEVYSFEVKHPLSHDQTDLIHNMEIDKDYVYRNLTKSEAVKRSMQRISRWSQRLRFAVAITSTVAIALVLSSFFIEFSLLMKVLNIVAIFTSIGSLALTLATRRYY